jgi:hypothetical protein
MIQSIQTFIPTFTYPKKHLENFLFFDIETTGLSKVYNCIYLIGCAYVKDKKWQTIQWFAKNPDEEPEILKAFLDFAQSYSGLIHFNGNRFDLPFLQARIEYFGILDFSLENYQSVDLLTLAKKYQKPLQLTDCKQKTIERFLQLYREDKYTGKQLIFIYKRYTSHTNKYDLNHLLLHNREDIIGLTKLIDLFYYNDFLNGDFSFISCVKRESHLILEYFSDAILPYPLQYDLDYWTFHAQEHGLHLIIPIFNGEMKYFYPNYSDYYYLVAEDQAIHKSLACFVDKEYRQKATKQTCYLRKSGSFLPVPKKLPLSKKQLAFQKCYKDKERFLLADEAFIRDESFLVQYLYALLP